MITITPVIMTMMNTGTMVTIMTAIGFIDRMDTTVGIFLGGIRGGGIGFGGDAIGVITSPGISTIAVSMWCGMIMGTGGIDRATGAASAIDYLALTPRSGSSREVTAYIFLKNRRAK